MCLCDCGNNCPERRRQQQQQQQQQLHHHATFFTILLPIDIFIRMQRLSSCLIISRGIMKACLSACRRHGHHLPCPFLFDSILQQLLPLVNLPAIIVSNWCHCHGHSPNPEVVMGDGLQPPHHLGDTRDLASLIVFDDDPCSVSCSISGACHLSHIILHSSWSLAVWCRSAYAGFVRHLSTLIRSNSFQHASYCRVIVTILFLMTPWS